MGEQDLERELYLKRFGLDDNQISELRKSGGDMVEKAVENGFLKPADAHKILAEISGEKGTMCGDLESIMLDEDSGMELQAGGGETLMKHGSEVSLEQGSEIQLDGESGTLMKHAGHDEKKQADETPTVQAKVAAAMGETVTLGTGPAEEQKQKDAELDELYQEIGVLFKKRYTLGREIARGGMGAVIEITDKSFKDKKWALKITLPGSDEERFKNEGYFTSWLEHQGIAPVTEIGSFDFHGRKTPYFVQKFVRGRDLEKVLYKVEEKDPAYNNWDLNKLLETFLSVCEPLEYAHRNGVIHRDLKPANIMIGENEGEVYLMDWGLAKKLTGVRGSLVSRIIKRTADRKNTLVHKIRGGLTRIFRKKEEQMEEVTLPHTIDVQISESYGKTMDGDVAGTPGYMSPEQADGQVSKLDARTDVFAMGAILYKILTFKTPFEGTTSYNVLAATLTKDPEPATKRWAWGKPERVLESIVNKALQKDPEKRYHSVKEMADDVKKYMRHETVSAHDYGFLEGMKAWNKRWHSIPLIASALSLFLLAAGGSVSGYLGMQKARAEAEARMNAEEAKTNAERANEEEKAKMQALEAKVARANASYLIGIAGRHFSKNNFQEAFNWYIQASEADPTHPEAWCGAGYMHYEMGNYVGAVEFFDKVIDLWKNFKKKQEEKKKRGEPEEKFDLDDGLAQKNKADALFMLGLNKRKKKDESYKKDWEEAERLYNSVIRELNPDLINVYNRRAILYFQWLDDFSGEEKKKMMGRALDDMFIYTKKAPDDPRGHSFKGYIEINAGPEHYEQAEKDLLVAVEGGDREAVYRIGLLYYKWEKPELARQYLLSSRMINPNYKKREVDEILRRVGEK